MNFFAQSAFENIREKIIRLREREAPQRRLIVTTSVFPSDVTLHLAKALEDFSLEDGRIQLTFKVAKNLAEEWRKTNEPEIQEMGSRGWLDDSGNLTRYRNESPPSDNKKIGLVVLVGADKVTDSSGLADFYRCDPKAIWEEQMEESFSEWTKKRLDIASVVYDDRTIELFDIVLSALEEQGCADFFQIGGLLRDLPLEQGGVQDGQEAELVLLRGLERFHLPSFIGFQSSRKKKLTPYFEAAIRFFRYDLFLEERTKKKALETIAAFTIEKKQQIEDNSLFTPDLRGVAFTNDKDFLGALQGYIFKEDAEARRGLLHSDFLTVYDKILKFKTKAEGPEPKETVHKLSGGPVEMILTALWQTFRDCCKECRGSAKPELKGIVIQSERFRHDNEGLSEGQFESAAEIQSRAREYLRKLVGSVDRYFTDDYLDTSQFGEGEVTVSSQLYRDDVDCTHARTAEPSLEFRIQLTFNEREPFSRKFAWRLPETQTYRMAEELVEWAAKGIAEKSANSIVLPVFHVRYHEELIRAKDDDETRQVVLHAVRDVAAEVTNLLTKDWIQQNDPLLLYLYDLAKAYKLCIETARKDGLHAIFHKINEGQPTSWEVLRKAYQTATRAYLGDDGQCQNSPMAPMLMRAFLIVSPRDEKNDAWVTEIFERSGVATVLHPSVLEMLCDHISYLFACFNYAAPREWRAASSPKAFHPSQWQDYLDLATIHMPLGGLIKDLDKRMDTRVYGQELLHRIGSPAVEEAPLSTRLLLRYEGFEEDDISDTEMFSETRESRLLGNILSDYLAIHPHARDGISIAVYRNQDIQPVISAVHTFLNGLAEGDTPVLDEYRRRPYAVAITVFTEAGEDVGVARWIEQWKERWEAAESEERYAVYRHCSFSIAHRVIPGDKDRKIFARMIRDGLDVDIAVLYDFIGAGLTGNEFQRVDSYDVRERTLKFPIIEKSFCMVDSPLHRLRRARVISNPQFSIASLHLETMARLKNENTPPKQEHVLIGYGDYEPWQDVIDELHKRAEWVVCIDPSIDDMLIKKKRDASSKEREIIGFGSGVGLHGELNFTISTEHFGLSDICFRLERAVAELYPGWPDSVLKAVAESVIKEAKAVSGLSLVRATGIGTYLHDFMAYALTSKLVTVEDIVLCSHLISLDAYRHWFTRDDLTRPDLLWLTARLDEKGRIVLDMHLIECKLALQNDDHVEKAVRQIQNGLRTLIPAFMPRDEKGGDDSRPDQRYWWLQLHRLIASKTGITQQRQGAIMAAMERLADGDYAIAWHGAVLAYWTDSENGNLVRIGEESFESEKNDILKFGIYAMGREAVRSLCIDEKAMRLDWPDRPIHFGDFFKPADGSKDIAGSQKGGAAPVTAPVPEKKEVPPPPVPKVTVIPPTPIPPEPARPIPERIYLGKALSGSRDIFWEFGHRELHNRHLLVFGTSGMGKTYAIQCLLCELGRQGQNVLVMDYTNGFLPNQLDEETKRILAPEQHIVRQSPLPISPFKLQVQEIGGGIEIPETLVSAAKRIASTFTQVYETLGDQQYSVLLDAIMAVIERYKNQASLEGLMKVLESFKDDDKHDRQKVLTIISKLKPFVLEKPFLSQEEGLDWGRLFGDREHRCHVFQFAGMDSVSARLVIEFTLWDLNAFVRGTGNKNIPKVVVLDEAQNLDLSEHSPVAKYLTEGRKFGLSLILATQTMKNLQGDKLNRLFQAGHKLFFRPADTELPEHAKLMVQSVGGTQQDWIAKLSALTVGQCYSLGPSLNTATGKLELKAFSIHIASLADRVKNA